MKIERAVWGLSATCLVAVLAVQCSGNKVLPPSHDCVLNSDCKSATLQCAQGFCVSACQASSDCPSGERCVALPVDNTAGENMTPVAGNICQVPAKKTCALNSDCTPLFCGIDLQCRSQCNADIDCPGGISSPQKCTTTTHLCIDPVQDMKNYDPVTNEIIASAAGGGGGSGSGAAGGKGGGTGGKGGTPGSTCVTTPQTAFANTAQGDVNLNFTSGVGARVSDRLLVFSAYAGPPVTTGAGGAPGGAGGAGGAGPIENAIFVQSFDADSGVAMGPAAPLFQIADGTNLYLFNVAVASTGEIVLLHGTGPVNSNDTTLYASFLKTTTAPGNAGVQFVRTVQIESAQFGNVGVFWSNANQEFVLYWKYITSAWALRVKKFQAGGTPAGGDTNAVATANGLNGAERSFGVGASGKLFAVAYRDGSTGRPNLTTLDADGNQVGGFTEISTVNFDPWIQVGGTSMGFVVLYQSGQTANEVFIPKTADGLGIQIPSGAGGAGGAGGTSGVVWPTFAVTSTDTSASEAFMISDEAGAGGVATVYQELNGASFLYITADGLKHYAVGTVISSTVPAGSQVAITTHHGSFGVSLYDGTKHSTQVAASACPP